MDSFTTNGARKDARSCLKPASGQGGKDDDDDDDDATAILSGSGNRCTSLHRDRYFCRRTVVDAIVS